MLPEVVRQKRLGTTEDVGAENAVERGWASAPAQEAKEPATQPGRLGLGRFIGLAAMENIQSVQGVDGGHLAAKRPDEVGLETFARRIDVLRLGEQVAKEIAVFGLIAKEAGLEERREQPFVLFGAILGEIFADEEDFFGVQRRQLSAGSDASANAGLDCDGGPGFAGTKAIEVAQFKQREHLFSRRRLQSNRGVRRSL